MALEDYNPVKKPTASNYNLEAKLPTQSLDNNGRPNVIAASNLNKGGIVNAPQISTSMPTDLVQSSNAGEAAKKDLGVGKTIVSGGIAALGELPNVIQNFGTDPRSEKEATGKVLSMAASGAKIGSVAGPWGALAVGGAMAGAGLISNAGWKQDKVREDDEEAVDEEEERIAERQSNFYHNKTTEQIKAERDLFANANGIITT